jgi:hypothetical protein
MWATTYFKLKKLPKVNNRPLDETSYNLVTLRRCYDRLV